MAELERTVASLREELAQEKAAKEAAQEAAGGRSASSAPADRAVADLAAELLASRELVDRQQAELVRLRSVAASGRSRRPSVSKHSDRSHGSTTPRGGTSSSRTGTPRGGSTRTPSSGSRKGSSPGATATTSLLATPTASSSSGGLGVGLDVGSVVDMLLTASENLGVESRSAALREIVGRLCRSLPSGQAAPLTSTTAPLLPVLLDSCDNRWHGAAPGVSQVRVALVEHVTSRRADPQCTDAELAEWATTLCLTASLRQARRDGGRRSLIVSTPSESECVSDLVECAWETFDQLLTRLTVDCMDVGEGLLDDPEAAYRADLDPKAESAIRIIMDVLAAFEGVQGLPELVEHKMVVCVTRALCNAICDGLLLGVTTPSMETSIVVKLRLSKVEEFARSHSATLGDCVRIGFAEAHDMMNVLSMRDKASLVDERVRGEVAASLRLVRLVRLLEVYSPASADDTVSAHVLEVLRGEAASAGDDRDILADTPTLGRIVLKPIPLSPEATGTVSADAVQLVLQTVRPSTPATPTPASSSKGTGSFFDWFTSPKEGKK